MKAAIIRKWGSPDVFELTEINIPVPNEDQLLIRVFACGINPVDWKHRIGNHKYILGSHFPIVLGYDVCGEVVEAGKSCRTFRKGDIVFGDLDKKYGGGLAEYCVGHEHCFAIKPEKVRYEQAAGVSLAGLTALQALRDKAFISPGKTVIINGASGGVGHIAVQIAKLFKTRVIAIASSRNREFVEKLNPDVFIDYTIENPLKINETADIFFDVSGKLSFLKVLPLLKPGGIYVTTLPRPKIILDKFIQYFTKNKRAKTLLRKHNQTDMQLLASWLEEGLVHIEIDRVFSLDTVSAAHEYSEKGHGRGKCVVLIQQ